MKRCVELLALSREHHTALQLARRAGRAAQSGDADAVHRLWREVAEYLDSELAAHFLIEEHSLLPALEDAGEIELSRRVRAEHRELRRLVEARAFDPEANLAVFSERLAAHVRFEEREVFETAQARLSAAQLAGIAAACAESSREPPG